MLVGFLKPGKASVIIGGQWGSEGKGAASAFVAKHLMERGQFFDIVTTNAGAQAGHTSIHNGKKRIAYHLPTYPLIMPTSSRFPRVYLNAGSIIDPVLLLKELEEHGLDERRVAIHPNAAIITQGCRDLEVQPTSPQTAIASTRKGVGVALSGKICRTGNVAKNCPELVKYVRRIDLIKQLSGGYSVLIEVPQGYSLSIDGPFYPYCTSRNCTVAAALSDAGIHPSFIGKTIMVIRTYPIRVGNIVEEGITLGVSGGHYPDHNELSWSELDLTPEITTVTGRQRRVFSFSHQQIIDAMVELRPDIVYVTFCDYLAKTGVTPKSIKLSVSLAARIAGIADPELIWQYGPTTDDVHDRPQYTW
jgi:adenylosuccinate synthase